MPPPGPVFGKIAVPCEWCGAHFLVWPSASTQKFCSLAHRRAWQRDPARRVLIHCQRCGRAVLVWPTKAGRPYCSRACYLAHAETPEVEAARFRASVDRRAPDECWPWRGQRDKLGYGRFAVKQEVGWGMVLAHRYAYRLAQGCWPAVARHICDHPWCVNPAHLVDGSQRDNLQDMWAKGRGKPRAKLTQAQVDAIRIDPRTQAAIAADYGVRQPAISRIKNGVRW